MLFDKVCGNPEEDKTTKKSMSLAKKMGGQFFAKAKEL